MSKIITLLSAAYVGGVLRHPHEGAISVTDAERDRLVDEQKLALDETDGFTKEQLAEMPDEPIAVKSGGTAAPDAANQHLSEITPTPAPKPARKGADTKE